MAVQFALRPRINLDRPVPRPRLAGFRMHPLVLPIAGYWLVIAGVLYAVLSSSRHPSGKAVVEDESNARSQLAYRLAENSIAEPLASPPSAPPSEIPPAAEATARGVPERERVSEVGASSNQNAAGDALVTRAEKPQGTLADRGATESAGPASPALKQEPAASNSETVKRPVEDRATLRSTASEAPSPKTSLPSCESAAASAEQTVDFRGSRGAPDLTRDAFAAVLEDGAYLGRCAIPAHTAIEICAAVQAGKVVGVSVRTEPQGAAINSCVRSAVAALRFPHSARLDVTRTRFEAAP